MNAGSRPPKRVLGLASATAVLAAVCALVSGWAAAESARVGPEREHLMLVPRTEDARQAAELVRPRVLATYESFDLVEAAGPDAAELADAGAQTRDDMTKVSTAAGSFDPLVDRAPLVDKTGDRIGNRRLAIVQFVGPVKNGWLQRLEATGAQPVSYLAQNGYLVEGTTSELADVGELVGRRPEVRSAIPLLVRDKLDPRLGESESDTASVAIQTVAGVVGADARGDVDRFGDSIMGTSQVDRLQTQRVELPRSRLAEIATNPAVVSIEPYVEPQLRDERAAQIVAGNLTGTVPSGTGYLSWLSGQGFSGSLLPFAIDVTDEGLDTGSVTPTHPDFYEQGSTSNPDRVVYVKDWTADQSGANNGRDCGGHGTNVASIAAGYNDTNGNLTYEDSAGYNYGLGVAPAARIGASKIFRCNNSFSLFETYEDLAGDAYTGGARVSNNSWGADVEGNYNADSRDYDKLVRDTQPLTPGDQPMVEVFSAGNDGPGPGTVGSPGNGKNMITVGAAENVRGGGTDGCGVTDAEANSAIDMIDFSSRGPTADGRTKPDLVAPGTHVTGASPQNSQYLLDGDGTCDPKFPAGNTFYSRVSGTSQAAPEVTGAAAMTMDWWRRTEGGGSTLPSPAMVKALLVNTATDIVNGDSGAGHVLANMPNGDQGWGRVQLGKVLDATNRAYNDQADVLGASGESVNSAYEVDDTSKPVKVTLAWTDAPGPTSGNSYVNDLDLVVTKSDGSYLGNVFSNGVSTRGGSSDRRNNVENVYLPAGTEGDFAISVVGTTIAGDGLPNSGDTTDQDFALVVSNASEKPGPVLGHDTTTLASSGSGDSAVEPGESFEFDETIRNAGTGTATGVSASATAESPGLTIQQPISAYFDLAADTTATNTSRFQAELDSTAQCGAPARVGLSVATDQGTQPVSLAFDTGIASEATSFPSSDVPKTIPSNRTATVDSTVTIGQSGTVRDINVSIGQINHTAVGDLEISLIGPDGTSVELFSRSGGTDNNIINTVFDDEAGQTVNDIGKVPPYGDSFRPAADRLSRFDGLQQAGTWTLRIRDLDSGNGGALQSWGTVDRIAQCALNNSGPAAAFNASPAGPMIGQLITLDSSGSSDDDTIASREWDLDGDGQFDDAVGTTVSKVFSSAGDHLVQLRVTDGNGLSDSTTKTLSVAPFPAPAASSPAATAPTGGSDSLGPAMSLASNRLRLNRLGRVALRVRCPSDETSCKGNLELLTRSASRPARLGRGSFRLAGAKTKTITVRLGRSARAYMRKHRSARVDVRFKATDAAGNTRTVRRAARLTRSI